jgi:microsomal dipeptidase-like Zn-dependent dipeptidase
MSYWDTTSAVVSRRARLVAGVAIVFASSTYFCSPSVPPVPPTSNRGDTSPTPNPPPSFPLHGFFDLHTHPLSNRGFAGKLVYGGSDALPGGGSILPADPDCHLNVPATSLSQALGHDGSTHGSWGIDLNPGDFFEGNFGKTSNACGDVIRQQVISAVQEVNRANDPGSDVTGFPGFPNWPVWSDITHQSMYVDWIQRVHQHGLNVMVALTVNNQTLADAVAGPGDGPDDDKASSDLQIQEIKNLASRHSDWMEVAYGADDLARIVTAGKMAVIIGMEVDNIGDFNKKPDLTIDDVRAEIARLYASGVRYLFPIHMIDNPFGTAAAYGDIFNLSNLREAGHFWNLQCAKPEDGIGYQYQLGNPLQQTVELNPPNLLTVEMAGLMVAKLGMLGDTVDPPTIPHDCGGANGMVNSPGLTPLGKAAIEEMMRQGMMIDVDHMSQASVNDALALAEAQIPTFPVNSGHNTVRRGTPSPSDKTSPNERSLTALQYQRIAKLHGMAGVGGANATDEGWVAFYRDIAAQLGGTDGIGFGTDADGVSPLMAPPPGGPRFAYSNEFPPSTMGTMTWDYNDAGVAHYGLIADFVHGLAALDGGAAIATNLQTGAQYFYDTWKQIEAFRAAHTHDAGAASPLDASVMASAAGALPDASAAAFASRGPDAGTTARPPSSTTASKSACPAGRVPDEWGTCVRSGAPHAAKPGGAAPFDGVHGKLTLSAGPYLLGLAVSGANRLAGVFDVRVAAHARRITLSAATGTGPKAIGGFRKKRFVMRIDAGAQVLLLNAEVSDAGLVQDLKGSFVAHAPGSHGVAGTFMLEPSAAIIHRPAATHPFADLETVLTALHTNRP